MNPFDIRLVSINPFLSKERADWSHRRREHNIHTRRRPYRRKLQADARVCGDDVVHWTCVYRLVAGEQGRVEDQREDLRAVFGLAVSIS